MERERTPREPTPLSEIPLRSVWRARRSAIVVVAVASLSALIFLVGIGAGLVVRTVPEAAAAASTQEDLEGRHRGDPKGRLAPPANLPIGASCADLPVPAASVPAAARAAPAVLPANAPSSDPVADGATDLGDLEGPVRPAMTAPAAQARRPAKPVAPPAFAARAPARWPTAPPPRAPTPATAEQRSANALFAGRL